MTYVGLRITRNIRHHYIRATLSQDISFFDASDNGSISMQAFSNGRLIQLGISEKLGQVLQAIATFVGAFIIAFVRQWKLTLMLIYAVPALIVIIGAAIAIDAKVETQVLGIAAKAGAFAESAVKDVRTVHAFDLAPRILAKYSKQLQDIMDLGRKKGPAYAMMFSGQYFIIFATMALAFWQGVSMTVKGEVDGIGTVFT
jgi:ATP-binding cassette, subfamily B (MDR/TAP), member 1